MKQAFINVNKLLVPKNRERKVNIAKVKELAKSIHTLGLISPIVVSRDKRTVVAGAHRVEACKLLEIEEIEARIILSEQDAKLVEIDENFKRNDLKPAERKDHAVKRMSEIILRIRETESDEVIRKAIQENVDNKNLSADDFKEALDIATGWASLESNTKPKVKEAVKKAERCVKKLAEDIVMGELGLSRRYLRDAVKTEKKVAVGDTPRIYFDDPKPEEMEAQVKLLTGTAMKKVRRLGKELRAELNEINSSDAKELETLIAQIERIGGLT
ncbi:hypothetical protein E2R68_02320 [Psychromonas sp. RZ22]|uniref:ParB N-terminal domain-containing protein n=1 Tax=Psychromonas algarum TaxID=2555643 RepID=UPI0010688509|nr:ParB N-terminal domain-containing protein [Psychromonas sp. RZ22]TEW55947.1 hypothetical protein E2R68_02320 [Psychromonas sp. RZ22]